MTITYALKSESDAERVEIAYRDGREVGYRITTTAGAETLLAPDGLTEIGSFDEVTLLPNDGTTPRRRRWFRRG